MRLYFILAFICKTFMVWPGANNQLDYNTVPDIQKYYLDGSKIHIVLMDMNTTLGVDDYIYTIFLSIQQFT